MSFWLKLQELFMRKQKNSMVLEQTSHQCKHTGPAQQVKTHPQKEGMDRIALHALFEERKKA